MSPSSHSGWDKFTVFSHSPHVQDVGVIVKDEDALCFLSFFTCLWPQTDASHFTRSARLHHRQIHSRTWTQTWTHTHTRSHSLLTLSMLSARLFPQLSLCLYLDHRRCTLARGHSAKCGHLTTHAMICPLVHTFYHLEVPLLPLFPFFAPTWSYYIMNRCRQLYSVLGLDVLLHLCRSD